MILFVMIAMLCTPALFPDQEPVCVPFKTGVPALHFKSLEACEEAAAHASAQGLTYVCKEEDRT